MGVELNGYIRSLLACIMLYCTIITSSTPVLPPSRVICPAACSCGQITIKCNNTIPTVVTDNVVAVIIDDVQKEILVPNVFCNVTWPTVMTLWLSMRTYLYLPNYVFNCLGWIQSLKISGLMWGISEQTFYGLYNVRSFDMSGNMIGGYILHDLLSSSLPRLTRFNLSNCNAVLSQWTLDQQIIDFLSIRPIQLLDLSRNPELTFNFRDASGLCKTIQTLLLHDSHVKYVNLSVGYCKSLQFVDLSGNQEFANGLKTCVDRSFTLPISDFYCAPTIRLDRLVTDATGYQTRNCRFLVRCGSRIRHLTFSNNFIPNFEMLFFFQNLEFIDLSNNNIKNINKLALVNIPSLKKVDLSHNKLNQMADFEGTFSSLFLSNPRLLSINLAYNDLSYLPGDTFVSNSNVTEIIMVHNSFEQVSLNLTHLLKLAVLDLRNNKIEYLDKESMEQVDKLHKTRHGSYQLQVLLEGNPFTCTCQAKEFLQWFLTSPIYNTSYTCHLDGETIPMSEIAIEFAQEDCERPHRRLRTILFSTLTPALALAVSTSVGIILYKIYKRRLEQQRLQDRLRLIQEDDTGFKFTVFLSYCSQDEQFVVEHIRQPLEKHLRSLTKINKVHICAGDHITPGHPVLPEIERLLSEAAVFVAVVSENYCNTYLCQTEVSEAHDTSKPIVLIFKEHISKGAIGAVVKNIFKSYVRAEIVQEGDGYQIFPQWEKLCKIIVGQITIQEQQNAPFPTDTE